MTFLTPHIPYHTINRSPLEQLQEKSNVSSNFGLLGLPLKESSREAHILYEESGMKVTFRDDNLCAFNPEGSVLRSQGACVAFSGGLERGM
jgi:hypothetical protein